MDDKYAYLIVSLSMLPIWGWIYYKAKRLRRRMIGLGVYGGVSAAATGPFFRDYWNPPSLWGIPSFYAPEDLIYQFLCNGIAIAIYNFTFRAKYQTLYPRRKKLSIFFAVLIVLSVFVPYIYPINSVIILNIALITCTMVMIYIRRDLLIPSLYSGFALCVILSALYVFYFNLIFEGYWYRHWALANTALAYYFLGIPWTEFVWYFAVGIFSGIVYDFASGTAKIPYSNDPSNPGENNT